MATTDARGAAQAARDMAVEVRDELPEALRNADVWLREAAARQPLVALGAALVAGYAIGRMFARR